MICLVTVNFVVVVVVNYDQKMFGWFFEGGSSPPKR